MRTCRRRESEKERPGSKLHRTPDFVQGVAVEVLRSGGSTAPRGGFQDVGMHTGHDAVPDTAWPLVREVIKVRQRVGVKSEGKG